MKVYYAFKSKTITDKNRPIEIVINSAYDEIIEIAYWCGKNNIKMPSYSMHSFKITYEGIYTFKYKQKPGIFLMFDTKKDAATFKMVWG